MGATPLVPALIPVAAATALERIEVTKPLDGLVPAVVASADGSVPVPVEAEDDM